MKIYTKRGDGGTTSLMDGDRIPKSSLEVHVLGELDELVAHLAVLRGICIDRRLLVLQERLMCVSGMIACGRACEESHKEEIQVWVKETEKWIDECEAMLPKLTRFIIPDPTSALFHVARAVCRRCERTISMLEPLPVALPFINCLSDLLFVLARMASEQEQIFQANGALSSSSPHRGKSK